MRLMKFTLDNTFHRWATRGKAMGMASMLSLLCFMLLGNQAVSQITASITVNSNVLCTGGTDGSLTAQGFGGWAPYTYAWSTGDTSQTISGLAAGTYTVTVQDIDLALAIVSATIFEPPPLGVILQPTGSCPGGGGGSITTVTFQGTPPYSYAWSDGQTGQTATNLAAGTYSVTVTDSNGCTTSESATVTNSGGLNLLTTASFETCVGSNDATATVVVQSGGVAPYTYLWSDGQTTDIAVNLSAGTYGVTVTDANGCSAEATQIVELSPEGIWLMLTATDSDCEQDNGTAHVSIMTGTPPFVIMWSNGDTTTDPTGLAPGTYSVTVTDVNGCSNSESVTVNGVDAPVAGTIITGDATEFCVTDGIDDIVTVTASGSTGANFRFVVTDSVGNILVVTTDNQFNFEGTGVGVCLIWGLTWDGTITGAEVGMNANNIQGCFALTDPIRVVREDCCVVDPGNLTADADSICLEVGGVTISATPDGSAIIPAGYETLYVLTSGAGLVIQATSATPSFTVNAAGSYTIHTLIYDPNTLDLSIVVPGVTTGFDVNALLIQGGGTICAALDVEGAPVTVLESPVVSIDPQDSAICAGESIKLTANATGNGLTYAWTASGGSFDDPTAMMPTYTMMMPGTYTISVVVTDENGCTGEASTTVTVNPNPEVSIDPQGGEICAGESIKLTANATGNGLTYAWTATGGSFDDPTAMMPNYTMMMPGTYTITVVVTDENGCSGEASTTVTVNPNPEVEIDPQDGEICAGESIKLTANATGNGLTYAWTATGGSFDDPTAMMPNYTMMMPGTYTITVVVTDENGCVGEASTTVTVNPNPEVEIDPIDATICVDQGLKLSAVSSSMGLTYAWTISGGMLDDSTAMMPVFTSSVPGTYTVEVTVTDANGCTGSAAPATITVIEPKAGTLTIDEAFVCLVDDKATVSATPNGDAMVPPGFETIFVLTSGTGLVIQQAGPNPSFMVDAVGKYTIHTLVYDPNTLDLSIIDFGVTTGFDVNSLLVQGGGDICASLDVAGAMVDVFMREIGDFVWLDENRNGIYERAIEGPYRGGATVKLFDLGPDSIACNADDVLLDETTTDLDGKYLFDCVKPGKYYISFMIMDSRYVFSPKDQGGDDELDTDADPTTGKTDVFMIMPTDGDDFSFDAGIHLKCDQVTSGGIIAENQTICAGDIPEKLTSVAPATGGNGELEYLWMFSTIPGQFDPATWEEAPGVNNEADYTPIFPVDQPTFFARCARRECCTQYIETNILVIDVVQCNTGVINFQADLMFDQTVMLNWESEMEDQPYNYFVERSTDGINFIQLDMVSGKGSGQQVNSYQFEDKTPYQGRNYYRVKQVGFLKRAYSTVLDVFVGNENMESVFLYPNPVRDMMQIEFAEELEADATLEVINSVGQIMYTQPIGKDTQKLDIDASALGAGTYFIRIIEEGSNRIKTAKLIKEE
ncbi:MAG: PKD domain-containing protein [Bacteroidota bacterium]